MTPGAGAVRNMSAIERIGSIYPETLLDGHGARGPFPCALREDIREPL